MFQGHGHTDAVMQENVTYFVVLASLEHDWRPVGGSHLVTAS